MAYVAMRVIRVNGEMRAPGDEVPEAATWRNIRPWLDGGYIREVPRDMVMRPAGDPSGEGTASVGEAHSAIHNAAASVAAGESAETMKGKVADAQAAVDAADKEVAAEVSRIDSAPKSYIKTSGPPAAARGRDNDPDEQVPMALRPRTARKMP